MEKNTDNYTELMAIDDNMAELIGGSADIPAFVMFDKTKKLDAKDLINLSVGENVSIAEIINTPLTLQGMGVVKLDYLDKETGEIGKYNRYILITDKGNFTTASAYIGRMLKILNVVKPESPQVIIRQKESNERRKFFIELV